MKSSEYTVVIPHRNEGKDLAETIANIEETQDNCAAIIAKEDKARAGTAATRHAGTMNSKTDIVISIDAHMRFEPGVLDRLAGFVAEDETRVACLSCHTNPECSFDTAGYWGADLHEFGDEYPLEPKWAKRAEPGEIACLMGACYGFSRAFYEKIGMPWSIGEGWGCDETLLSIPARLAGGSVHVLSGRCAHRSRRPEEVRYRQTPDEIAAIWRTRAALISLIRPDNAAAMRKRMNVKAPPATSTLAAAKKALDKARVMDWAEFRRRWLVVKEPSKSPTAPPSSPSLRLRLPSVPDPGIRCPHCGEVSDRHRITNTWPNGNRRRVCASCERPFVSRYGV